MIRVVTLVLALAASGAAIGQDRLWVADRLYLGLYSEPDNGGERLTLLPSGESVEILERAGDNARVRTGNGTEGWVRATFLTAEMPANARVRELDPRIAELEAENARLERAVAEAVESADSEPVVVPPPAEPDPRVERALADAERRISELAEALAEARAEAAREPEPAWRVHWPWFAGGGVVLLLAGGIAGFVVFDWWSRRRHGGFRLW